MPTLLSAPAIPTGLSYAEFLLWLDEDVRAEWVMGEIIVMSPASRLHQRIAGFLTAILKLYVEPRGLGEVIPAPFQMRAGEDLPGREPDLLFVSADRVDIVCDTFVDGPADLVVEIISPESRTRDTVDKFAEYERGGVGEYWLIDPENQNATFYELVDGSLEEIPVAGTRFQSHIIPGFWLEESWLWSIPCPSIPDVQNAWGKRPLKFGGSHLIQPSWSLGAGRNSSRSPHPFSPATERGSDYFDSVPSGADAARERGRKTF